MNPEHALRALFWAVLQKSILTFMIIFDLTVLHIHVNSKTARVFSLISLKKSTRRFSLVLFLSETGIEPTTSTFGGAQILYYTRISIFLFVYLFYTKSYINYLYLHVSLYI